MVAVSPDRLRDDALRFFREEEAAESLEWIHDLSPVNLRLFTVELADALKQATISGDLDALVALIEDWEATADLDATPDVLAEVQRPKQYRPLESFNS